MQLVLAALAGVVAGIVLLALVVLFVARTKMIVAEPIPLSFDDAVRTVTEAVPAVAGWGMPAAPLDMTGALAAKGISIEGVRRAQIFFLCNPRHAAHVLGAAPWMMGMMPCSWALFEKTDGSVHLSSMNMPLLSRIFSGDVGRVLRQVASEEERMRARLHQTSAAGVPAAARA